MENPKISNFDATVLFMTVTPVRFYGPKRFYLQFYTGLPRTASVGYGCSYNGYFSPKLRLFYNRNFYKTNIFYGYN